MGLELPFWVIIYISLLISSSIGTIIISPDKNPLYILSELSVGIFSASFFLIYYGVLNYPSSFFTILAMVAFIIYQEAWVNRALYREYLQKPSDMSDAEFKGLLIFTIVVSTILLLPLIWVIYKIYLHYN